MSIRRYILPKISVVLISLFMVALIGGCSTPLESESLKYTGIYFDTVIQIEAWGAERSVMDECADICEKYEKLFSPTIETSDISRINSAGGSPVTVSEETADLILTGIKYGELSGGKFDITIASAVNLWNFRDNDSGSLPDPDVLSKAVTHIDYRNISIEGNSVTLLDPDARIDLGGIAKGYIGDRIKEHLVSSGIEHATINLGGNMLAVGGRTDGTDFCIGIQKPFAQQGTVLGVLSVSDKSVVSSGNYERYFEKDGIIYHHILDPDTGYPVQNSLDQVTIISEHSVDGDALSTTCFALGLEDGMELVRSLSGIEAVFVTKDGQIHKSSPELEIQDIK